MPLHTKQQRIRIRSHSEHKENHLTDHVANAASKPGSGSIMQSVESLLVFLSVA